MKKLICSGIIIGLITFPPIPQQTHAGLEPFIGEIMMFGGNFCPRGWADTNGQLLPVSQNQALFSLLGTIYGGDGRTTFALPDMRGRVALHNGQGPGLSNRKIGSKGGAETHTLNVSQMPSHTHNLKASGTSASSKSPTGKVLGKSRRKAFSNASGSLAQMAPQAVGTVGNGQPHNNMQPFITIRYCIALQGIYPSRN